MAQRTVKISDNFYKKLLMIKKQFLIQGVALSTAQAADAFSVTRDGGKYHVKKGAKVVTYESI